MPVTFHCPKCGQKLTLTASKPGDWLDCPGCEAAITVPGQPAPASTAKAAPPVKRPPAPPARPAVVAAHDDGFDLPSRPAPPAPARPAAPPTAGKTPGPPKWWADKRVQVGGLLGGAVLLVVVLLAATGGQKPAPTPEVARGDPPPGVPVPVLTTPNTTPTGSPEPTLPKPPEPKKKVSSLPEGVEPKIDAPPRSSRPLGPQEVGVAPYPKPLFAIVEPKREFDQFGNQVGENLGLARDGEFRGQRVLFWSPHTGAGDMFFGAKNPMWKALESKGFTVRREFGKFQVDWLKDIDQLWILSTAPEEILAIQRNATVDIAALRKQLKALAEKEITEPITKGLPKGWTIDDAIEMTLADIALGRSPSFHLNRKDFDAIEKFVRSGRGLCLLADNDPFVTEASELGKRLFGVTVSGNYQGTKIAYVKNGELRPDDIKKFGGDYEVPSHPLLTGVNFVYEGITISTTRQWAGKLEVALPASDGNPVVLVSKEPELRVVIDCGFTRYCHGPSDRASFINMTAGTTRLAQNIAAFLAGKGDPKKP